MPEGKKFSGEMPPEETLPETPELREAFLRAKKAAARLAAIEGQEEDGDEHIGDAFKDPALYKKPERTGKKVFPWGRRVKPPKKTG